MPSVDARLGQIVDPEIRPFQKYARDTPILKRVIFCLLKSLPAWKMASTQLLCGGFASATLILHLTTAPPLAADTEFRLASTDRGLVEGDRNLLLS